MTYSVLAYPHILAGLRRLSLERLQTLLDAVPEVSRLTDEVVQDGSVLLIGILIGAIQAAIVKVGNAGHVRIVRGDGILYRSDLRATFTTKRVVPSERLGRAFCFNARTSV